MSGVISRCKDNFFIVAKEERASADRDAVELSALLMMPVKFEWAGREARCLELRLWWADGCRVKSVLAYRTDADRQGECGDVRTWPEWSDQSQIRYCIGAYIGKKRPKGVILDPNFGQERERERHTNTRHSHGEGPTMVFTG